MAAKILEKPVFDRENITLILPIKIETSSFKDVEKVGKQKNLYRKREHHVTLIGRATGEIILEKLNGKSHKEKEEILDKIITISKEFNWNYSPVREYYFITKLYVNENGENEERQSIIQLFTLPNLVPFYKKLNWLAGTDFNPPFPHVTIFTKSTKEENRYRGIGIYSEKEFHSLNPIKIIP